ncbi:hypothetical protein SAMD00019534_120470 [Acytostelium subglobosum LB1]|uniref:hypothetical protein n=1 Tax=Acytostelium subglobosum LB1 TaxID=1410327 RepID=UPI000644DAC3|nr:hypothetical protein SAMD00019534_120470 [Acytostelium subglobosum LB1]GAM28871.1 hypothetical protein SAMD00019534_120470 [Acytostelium subglobosum LB1]|eukprot:XP_012748243.1 hypothetical protein SAMD00019534_120470 [Acytostelium subglobosum LB1]
MFGSINNGVNNRQQQQQQQNKKGFTNFKWANNGDLLTFPSTHSKQSSRTSNKDADAATVTIDKVAILSGMRKFYNEIYSHFYTLQTLVNESSRSCSPDERVREIAAISNRYQSVLLSTREQLQRSLDNASYLDFDDEDNNAHPFDQQLIQREKSRIEDIMRQSKASNVQLLVFCGSVHSIYPLLCAKLSREQRVNCRLIARESNTPMGPEIKRSLEHIQDMLTVLDKQKYAQRLQYIDSEFGQHLDNLTFVECDSLYQRYKGECENLQVLSIIWKITHLFYFSSTISPYQLLDCLQIQRQRLLARQSTMTESSALESDEGFDYINELLVTGCIKEAIYMLNLHSRLPKSSMSVRMSTMRKSPIGSIIELLQRMPILHRLQSHNAANEYLSLWARWYQEAEDLRMAYHGTVDQHLQAILDIIAGNEATVQKYSSGDFLTSVVANILFVEHQSSIAQIRQLFLRCYQRLDTRSTVDRIMLSFATSDLEKALKRTSKHFPTWTVAHITDLLYHHPYVLKKHYTESSPLDNIRDGLFVDYAQFLSSQPSLVEVACGYLQHTKAGSLIIDQIIQHQQITSERQALKLLRLCQSDESERYIFRMLSLKDFENERYASALGWLLKGKDTARITQMVNYLLTEKLDSNLLDDLQSLMEANPTDVELYKELDFLIKYKELITLWKNKNFEDYSKCLCGMLRDRVVPKPFWMRMLLDVVPMLESDKKVYFNMDDTVLMLNCLEEICSPHLMDQYLDGVSDQELQTLRLALARNASKALMMSTSSSSINQIQSDQSSNMMMISMTLTLTLTLALALAFALAHLHIEVVVTFLNELSI